MALSGSKQKKRPSFLMAQKVNNIYSQEQSKYLRHTRQISKGIYRSAISKFSSHTGAWVLQQYDKNFSSINK